MIPIWRIDIRLGEAADKTPIRTVLVEARDEAEALRIVLARAEADLATSRELLEDGQEEVFSRTEVEAGAIEHRHESD